MKISCVPRLFQSLVPIITRTSVRVNAVMRGRAIKSGEYPHRKNRAFRRSAETLCFHFWEVPNPYSLQFSIIGIEHRCGGANGNGVRNRLCQIDTRDCVRAEVRQQENQRNKQDDFPPDGEEDCLRCLV